MRIDEKLETIVSKIEGLSFEYNDFARFNERTTLIKMPVCFVEIPLSGLFRTKHGIYRDKVIVTVSFLSLAELDFEGKKNEIVVEQMKMFAKQFINQLNKSNLFKPLPDNVPYYIYYNKLNDNLTGVSLNLELEDLKGVCL